MSVEIKKYKCTYCDNGIFEVKKLIGKTYTGAEIMGRCNVCKKNHCLNSISTFQLVNEA